MSECFCQVTAYEIAYSRSAESMRGLVMASFLFMNAISSALAQAVTPVMKDPNLIYIWAGPAVAMFVVSVVFYLRHRHMDE
jgi:dipeptide/tripeptide permease